jgi:signal peptide peptidase-like protein 2B
MFCLASVMAIYSCFEPLVMWSYKAAPNCPTIKIPKMNLYLCVLNMELRQFLLMCIAISITVVWVVYRKADWAWALQDTLGVLFSLNMLKTLRLPSLKIITILLSTLFIYDIFFVFVTPLITKVFC